MKDQLIFDVTDATTMAQTDQVGAIIQGIRSGAKELINSQQINSLEWLNVAAAMFASDGVGITQTGGALDVNLKSPVVVAVDLDGDYDVSTNPTPDSVGLIAHDRNATPGAAQQNQRPTAAAPGTLASASLGTAHGLDTNAFMMAIDDVSGDAELLSKDNVSNGLNVHLAGSDVTIAVSDAALAQTAIATAEETLDVAATAQDVVASPLAARKYLYIYNYDNQRMFVGQSGVTAADGFPISPGSYMELRAGAAVDIEYVSAKLGHAIRTMELS
jgi:hypothetical protein